MNKFISSPLNYTGGKYKLLPQILPLFPKKIDTFVDLFCGGCNVGINAKSKNVIFNDKNLYIIELFNVFKKNGVNTSLSIIDNIIRNYNLSNSTKEGYGYYDCNSSIGLSAYNKKYFTQLRNDFNLIKIKDDLYYYMLYVLIVYSFNNQIRFNSKGCFNLPAGKRDFNKNIESKLINFVEAIIEKKCKFTSYDFNEFNFDKLAKNDFVYVDPPYLITCATYNENNAWNRNDENRLLDKLDYLDRINIKFALSNVLFNKNKCNDVLIEWTEKNKGKYRVHHLNYRYSNSNYQIKDKTSKTDEVLITNY